MPKQEQMTIPELVGHYDGALAQIKADIKAARKTRRELRRDIQLMQSGIMELSQERNDLERDIERLQKMRDLFNT